MGSSLECKNLVVQKSSEPCKLASWSEVLLLRHAKAQVTAEFHDSILSGECDISIQDFVVFFVKTAGAPSEKHTGSHGASNLQLPLLMSVLTKVYTARLSVPPTQCVTGTQQRSSAEADQP